VNLMQLFVFVCLKYSVKFNHEIFCKFCGQKSHITEECCKINVFDLRSNASLCLRVTQVGVLFDEGQVMQPQIHTERDGLQASSVYLERDQTKKKHVNSLNNFTLFIKVALCPFFD